MLEQRRQHRTRRVARARIEHGERLAPLGGEGEEALPAVVRRAPCPDQAAALQALQQPAEIAEVEAEVPAQGARRRSEEHTSELQSQSNLVCRLLPEKNNNLWRADYKGEFMLADRRYCYPRTITDFATRYLLSCEALSTPHAAYALTVFERASKTFGL